MTKIQRERLVAKIFTFLVVLGMLTVWLPYFVVFMAIYIAIQITRKI